MNLSSKNPYKFKLFRGRPVAAILSLAAIVLFCHFAGKGRIGGQVQLSTPTQIDAHFQYFYGHINKTFILDSGKYTVGITDRLNSGDLHYSLLLDGNEILSTCEPIAYTIDADKGTYSVVVTARQWTQGSFHIEATPAYTTQTTIN